MMLTQSVIGANYKGFIAAYKYIVEHNDDLCIFSIQFVIIEQFSLLLFSNLITPIY